MGAVNGYHCRSAGDEIILVRSMPRAEPVGATNRRNSNMSAAGFPPTRVGAVSYLNSKPLIEGLEQRSPETDLILDYPSRLADQLAQGQLDVALIPSVEYFRNPGYEIVSDACVAARGPVLSVRLYCRVHPGDIRTLALDEGSRTSSVLVRIILAEKYGVDPELLPLPLSMGVEDTTADAILVIGDRAICSPNERFHETWDLGEEWLRWTGLSFVFAMWVARRDFDKSSIEPVLSRARDRGVASLEFIAHREARLLGIDEALAFEYLHSNLHFRFGAAERHGLKLFQQLATERGFVPEGVDLVFRDYVTA